MLRKKVEFRVFSGLKEITFSTKQIKFRNKKFDVIKINNQISNLTTDMGRDWELWFAIREIYCNAIDEGGQKMDVAQVVNPEVETTKFYIKHNKEIGKILDNWNNYFSAKRKDLIVSNKKDKIFVGGKNLVIYRKGIRVGCNDKIKSLYHYDFNHIEINESRVISNMFEFEWNLIGWWKENATSDMIKNLFEYGEDNYEWSLDWSYGSCRFNQDWLKVLDNRSIILEDVAGHYIEEYATKKKIILPNKLGLALLDNFGDKVKVVGKSNNLDNKILLNKTDKQKLMVEEVIEFLEKGGVSVKTKKIEICKFENEITLGQAKDNTIFLSFKTFEKGKKVLALTMLEEYAHLESGFEDKTRNFQDYLVNMLISKIEKETGNYL